MNLQLRPIMISDTRRTARFDAGRGNDGGLVPNKKYPGDVEIDTWCLLAFGIILFALFLLDYKIPPSALSFSFISSSPRSHSHHFS